MEIIKDRLQANSEPRETTRGLNPDITTAFRLPTALLCAVDGWCLQHDINRSQFIRGCIRDRLKVLGAEPDP